MFYGRTGLHEAARMGLSGMIRIMSARLEITLTRAGFLIASLLCVGLAPAQTTAGHAYFIDCSATQAGDGSSAHPWNTLVAAEAYPFASGDRIALARGTACHGTFAPPGSGSANKPIRLTAYGEGPRPRIIATASDRQVLRLFNQEYWQVDSLDLSGASQYGVFVSGDKAILHHIELKNLYVHDIRGGEMKNKDNGLIVVGAGSRNTHFEDVLVDGVVAAHTNQWAGILVGGGNFGMDMPLNQHVTVRNASVHDVYGDGIVLFRVSDGVIETSTAWETGMQPTQTIGTPNAIWTWSCTDCVVRDNEAFLTDSPGVDGGAYDIDWNNTRNTVERNYAHDTQGYCVAVFAAGYVTSESVIRDNLCISNARSPRLAALQGAVYLHTWNGGVIRDLRLEHNTILWSPTVAAAAAIVDDANAGEMPIVFTDNRIESSAPHFYQTNSSFAPSANHYRYSGESEPRFRIGDNGETSLAALQAMGLEKGTTLEKMDAPAPTEISLHLNATVDCVLDKDGLLGPETRAQLMVLRSLAAQYGAGALDITVHLRQPAHASPEQELALANALLDLDAPQIHFVKDGSTPDTLRLSAADGRMLEQWRGFQNAKALGGVVRARLGAPRFAAMEDQP